MGQLHHPLQVQCPRSKVSPLFINIVSPMSVTSTCGFFLFVCVCLRMQHTKIQRLQTKTESLRVFILDRAKFFRQSVVVVVVMVVVVMVVVVMT